MIVLAHSGHLLDELPQRVWRKKYIFNGAALMNTNDVPRGKLPEREPASSREVE